MTKLSAPKNVREIKTKCCNNCAYLIIEEDKDMVCKRDLEDIPWADFGDGEMGIHMVVCDGHKVKNSKG